MPIVRTDFPGGNGREFDWVSSDHLRFAADCGPGPVALWFHFRIEDFDGNRLVCEQTRGRTVLGWPFEPVVRPVCRRGAGLWKRSRPLDVQSDTFRFELPEVAPNMEVAFCAPYQPDDWIHFLASHPCGHEARRLPIGRTENGLALDAWEWGDGADVVALTARAHAGETPASRVLEGMLDGFCAMGFVGLNVRVIPFLDLDGVTRGWYGKNRPPVDFYMAWGNRARVETEAAARFLAEKPPAVAVDLHAPLADNPSFLDLSLVDGASLRLRSDLSGLAADVLDALSATGPAAMDATRCVPHPAWFPDGFSLSLPGSLQARHETVAMTWESAYHVAADGSPISPESSREQGRRGAAAIVAFLERRRANGERKRDT